MDEKTASGNDRAKRIRGVVIARKRGRPPRAKRSALNAMFQQYKKARARRENPELFDETDGPASE